VRKISGDVRLEPRGAGRAVLVLRSDTGETFGIERSPDQLADLRDGIDKILTAETQRRRDEAAKHAAEERQRKAADQADEPKAEAAAPTQS
jgi:hypothetical protein